VERFKAGVQYGDWEGTAAADDADPKSLEHYLRENALIKPDEFLIATSLFVGDSSGDEPGFLYIRALLFEGTDYEDVGKKLAAKPGAIPVREVEIKLTMAQFVALFKRFDVMFTWHRLGLEGREFKVVEE
jgi:hypothetical protein